MEADLSAVASRERLEALWATGLLDSPREPIFDRLTRLGTLLTGASVALVSLVDRDRQFFKSDHGLPEPVASRRETPLSHSFCKHVVASGEPLIIQDARQHPLVCDNPAVRELPVIAYLGIPLRTFDGHVLGTFCLVDREPRTWTDAEVQAARELAAATVTEIDLRARLKALEGKGDRAAARPRAEALGDTAKSLRREIGEATESMLAWARDLTDVPALDAKRALSLQVVLEQARRIADAARRLEHVETLAHEV
ncbi:MAG TPA: GAF domain-containing protein [Gemmatimonadales bacterium]|nr:GAF domain-containing protein [Gemmatimonadales bacterium]